MTLQRPAYRVTVTNVDQGWTQTAEQGEIPPALENVTAFLTDDFQLGWGLEGDQLPAKFAADTASFKLFCRTADDVPAIEVGDVFTIDLDRPGAGGTLIPYMHFAGRGTDPEATTIPGRGIEVSVSAVGFLADLSPNVDLGNDASVSHQTEGFLMNLVRDQAGVSAAFHSPAVFTRNVRPYGQMTAEEAADRLIAGSAAVDYATVLRSAYRWARWDPTSLTNDGLPPNWRGYEGDNPDLTFYLQKWLVTPPAPFTLVADGRKAVLGPDAGTVDQVSTVPASVCRVPGEWKKSRADLVNTTTIVYPVTDSSVPGDDGLGGLKEGRATVRDASSVARYGPAPREVQTFIFPGAVPTVAAVYQDPSPGTLSWSIDSLPVLPALMDDSDLDELAADFYPHAMPRGSVAGRFLVLTDVDHDTAVAGRDVLLQLVGATFNISNGELVITATVRAANTALGASLTFTELGASPLADTTFIDTGAGHYIDPTLDIDELTFTS